MDQTGHTDPTFTLRVYRHAMRRDELSKATLRALVGAEIQAEPDEGSGRNSGTNAQNDGVRVSELSGGEVVETAY